MFGNNPYAADYIPRLKVYGSEFRNLGDNVMAWIYHPPIAWANIDDCGLFPCTAPNNTLIMFEKISFSGVAPARSDNTF